MKERGGRGAHGEKVLVYEERVCKCKNLWCTENEEIVGALSTPAAVNHRIKKKMGVTVVIVRGKQDASLH